MYIDSFKVFCDLVDTGSFSKAAVRNEITQSAVSQQLRSLETRFKSTLMERGLRNLCLTPEGAAFHRTCRSILEMWDDFEHELRGLRSDIAGEIRVVSTYSIGLHDLPPRLKNFRSRFPQVEVKVEYCRSSEVYQLVDEGMADVGLVTFPARRKRLVFEIFDQEAMVVICHPTHRLADRRNISLSALGGERFVSFRPDMPTRNLVDKNLRALGVEVVHTAEFDNIETVKRAVEVESAVSIVPAHTVLPEVGIGQLASLAIDPPTISRPLGMILSRTRSRPPGMKEFIGMLKVR